MTECLPEGRAQRIFSAALIRANMKNPFGRVIVRSSIESVHEEAAAAF